MTEKQTDDTRGKILFPAGAKLEHKINALTTLLNNSEVKVNHFDSLRQRYMVIALAVFAGLFGFTSRAPSHASAVFSAAALSLLMILFLILDHRLDVYHNGWQSTRKLHALGLGKLFQEPPIDVYVPRYNWLGEKRASFFGLKAIIYQLLVLGGPVAYFAFWLSF